MASGSGSYRYHSRGGGGRPPHLRGREIGMFYAKRSREKAMEKEDQNRLSVQMAKSKVKELTQVLQLLKNQEFSPVSTSIAKKFTQWNNKPRSLDTEGDLSLQRHSVLDDQFLNESKSRSKKARFMTMFEKRKKLPSYAKQEDILKLIKENQVVVVTGETGCGKTTQVPQYILDSMIDSGKGSVCKIVCTQPRRISAISVAERVAEERDISCGNGNEVGYQIRLENKLPRELGSILYCTTGIMLQQLQFNPHFQGISHIVVDEVHERDIQSDFLLINLKDLLEIRKDLKLILMSATLNANAFSEYFGGCPMIEIPGFTYPVEEFTLEDMIEKTNYRVMSQAKKKRTEPVYFKYMKHKKEQFNKEKEEEANLEAYLQTLTDKYSESTIESLRNWDDGRIDLDLILAMLKHINQNEKEGAVLVFLPGWQEISNLHKLITSDLFFSTSRFLIIPLHSLMPTLQQREVFNEPPKGVQKIILATNIAETSITIDDVVYVIDCGKIKMKSLDSSTNMQLLQAEWVALANAKQRRGRAGRTRPGVCYHMYTRLKEKELPEYQLPEMLRTTLEEIIMTIKLLKLGPAVQFLTKALNPPAMPTALRSLEMLMRINALTKDECLTPLGYHLARLPMDPHTGKMILMGAIFSCLDPILSVAASLSFKDAFVIPLGKERQVDQQKRELAGDTQSDHLMFANVIKQWEKARARGHDGHFCWENFLSSSTLRMLADLKKQFAQYLKNLNFLNHEDPKHPDYNRNSGNTMLLKAIICAGLYPNVAKINLKNQRVNANFKKTLRLFIEGNKKASVHPKSVNAYETNLETGWLVYHLMMKSSEIYVHDVTPVTAYSLLFFGGDLKTSIVRGYECITVDDWIELQCSKNEADAIQSLRNELDKLLQYKIENPGVSNWDPDTKEGMLLRYITDLITSEETLTVAEIDSY